MDFDERSFQAGFASSLGVLIEALTCLPSPELLHRLYGLADTLGLDAEPRTWDDSLTERFQQRLLVPGNPLYIPLCEQPVRTARVLDATDAKNAGKAQGNSCRYGSFTGNHASHVAACYQALGFDWRNVRGFEPLVSSLRVDSLAGELLFIKSLMEEGLRSQDASHAAWCRSTCLEFMGEHTLPFLRKLNVLLEISPSDYLTDALLLALELIEGARDALR